MGKIGKGCFKCITLLTMILAFGTAAPALVKAEAGDFWTLTTTREMKRVSEEIDIDGDGTLNTVAVYYRSDSEEKYPTGYTQKVYVEVDGKSALVFDTSKYVGYGAEAVFMDTGAEGMCMQIWAYSDNDYIGYNQLFGYDKDSKSFYKLLDLTKGADRYGEKAIMAEEGRIVVTFGCQPAETGWLHWERAYIWEDGKLVAESDTDTSVSGVVAKYVTDRKLKFYEEPGGKKAAFTLKKGVKVSLKGVKVTKKKMYAQFQYGEKTGWLRIENDYSKVYKYDKKGNVKCGYFKGIWKRLVG